MTSYDPTPEDELALRCREGDPRALAILYCRHAPALVAYVERLLRERAEAEDVVHESFLRLVQGRGRYQARGRFRSWLFTVATNLAQDRLRTSRRREWIVSGAVEELAPARLDSPEELAAVRELARQVESALHDLPETYAAALQLRVHEDFSYREMAAITGDSEGTLRSRVHHALKRVRSMLTERRSSPGAERQRGRLPHGEE